jgi:hypothetical protein
MSPTLCLNKPESEERISQSSTSLTGQLVLHEEISLSHDRIVDNLPVTDGMVVPQKCSVPVSMRFNPSEISTPFRPVDPLAGLNLSSHIL